ncbi:MAG: DnaA/Hda family protein, partial [Pseudomonadota bacterium]
MTQEQWGQIKQALLDTVGGNNYKNWIEPLELKKISDDVATFRVPTTFIGNYVSQNFGDLILYKVAGVAPEIRRIDFEVAANLVERPKTAESSKAKTKTGNPEAKAASRLKEGTLTSAPLDDRFTFDTFVVGKPNELAHAAARRVAEGGPVTFNPLFLYGGVGLGKTHLMHAIAWELKAGSPNLNVVYLSAEQFMYRFVQALRDRRMMDFKEMFRSVDVLMVDDVQFIAGKDST